MFSLRTHRCRLVAICQGRMAYFSPESVNMRKLKEDAAEVISTSENRIFIGTTPGGGRTHNLWLRRPTLYPVELRARTESELATDSADFHRFSARCDALASS